VACDDTVDRSAVARRRVWGLCCVAPRVPSRRRLA
jgi:hypothetical protein